MRAMVGQQITVTAARTALTALTDALGEPVVLGPGNEALPEARLFPTMAAIAAHGHEVLRGPAARTRAIIGAASALADGTLCLGPGDEGADQRAALLALPGIGVWTADYVRMRVLGDTDVFLPGDVAVRAGAARAGLPSDARPLDAWAARTAPWRSYLTAHLWRAAAVPPSPPAGQADPRIVPNSGRTTRLRPANPANTGVGHRASRAHPEYGTQTEGDERA